MATVYLSNDEMSLFYDLRRLKDLLTDDGTGDTLSPSDILANTLLTTAVLWASSEIDAKCQNGKRYARADLEQMVTDAIAGTDAQKKRAATLKKLAADLAFGFLAQRRAQSATEIAQLAPAYEEALGRLEQLYDGKKIFDLDANLAATVPTLKRLGALSYLQSHYNEMFGCFPDDNQMFNNSQY